MSALLQLAERCEAATRPDRELDMRIAVDALGAERASISGRVGQMTFPDTTLTLPEFTVSIDAAMTLVPEGHDFGVGRGIDDTEKQGWAWCGKGEGPYCWAATPALALTAAALRARATEEPQP